MEKQVQIVFFWSSKVKRSVEIKDIINKSPYGDVIDTISADNVEVRNRLMYGKHPQATIPIFMVVENGSPTFYSVNDWKKIMNLTKGLLENLNEEEVFTEATASNISHSIANLSFSDAE